MVTLHQNKSKLRD